jgi:predicted small lipoprotein YifL
MEQNCRAGSLVINGTDNVDIGAEKFRCLGSYAPGTQITIEYNVSDVGIGCFGIELYRFNMEKWNSVYNSVKSSGLEVTSFKNTDVKGNITVPVSSMVMTTIPQDGGWKVYVDGKRVEDFKVLGSLMAFNVAAGSHTVEFKYHVPAFAAGILLSLIALAAIAACYFIWRKGGLHFPKKEAPAENKSEGGGEKDDSSDEAADDEPEEEAEEEAPEPVKQEKPASGKKGSGNVKKKNDLPKKHR